MKKPAVICSWCGLIIADGSLPVSHGMCKSCTRKQLRAAQNLANAMTHDWTEVVESHPLDYATHKCTSCGFRIDIDNGDADIGPCSHEMGRFIQAGALPR